MKLTITRIFTPLLLIAALLTAYANHKVMGYEVHTTDNIASLPIETACLVLGTTKYMTNNSINPYYRYRIDAAADAYFSGKCSKMVVSGDNRRANYNEPDEMKLSLIEYGVPAENIHCDYAGGRTLDSVIRFKRIFGQSAGIVISQQFHNARAIYIGQANGIKLTGYNAKNVDTAYGLRTNFREVFSRIRALLDVELLHSEPRHYGAPITI